MGIERRIMITLVVRRKGKRSFQRTYGDTEFLRIMKQNPLLARVCPDYLWSELMCDREKPLRDRRWRVLSIKGGDRIMFRYLDNAELENEDRE